jgi:hypothetical protein
VAHPMASLCGHRCVLNAPRSSTYRICDRPRRAHAFAIAAAIFVADSDHRAKVVGHCCLARRSRSTLHRIAGSKGCSPGGRREPPECSRKWWRPRAISRRSDAARRSLAGICATDLAPRVCAHASRDAYGLDFHRSRAICPELLPSREACGTADACIAASGGVSAATAVHFEGLRDGSLVSRTMPCT